MAQNNPYIGPRTFQRNEGHLFFGREREARDLIALVASERLVVFYAQSGAGKSSIVNTRLIPNLESKEYEVLPVGRISGDLTAGESVDNIYIHNLIRSLEQHDTDAKMLASLTISDFLAHINYDDKGFFYDPTPVEADPVSDPSSVARRALIIDQFEELFSTYPESWEKRENFFEQLAKAMEDDPQLWVVLVMREDYIAALDPYAHLVSNGLRVRYYMQRLGREAALKAVKSPVEGIRPYAEGVAEKLIDDLCSIKVQKPNGMLDVQPGQYAEPVQMQVVCYGLWDNLPADGTQISEKDLQDVGDVNQSLGKYYDKRVGEVAKAKNVRERLIREWFEKKLITAGGIRNMVLQEREPKPGELHDDVIQALQSDLVRGEKRGGATWYELTHDRLVEPVLERNKIWFAEHLSPLQRQAALWKDQDQNESWLRAGDALGEFEAWAKEHQGELTEIEGDFLEACRKLQAQIDERQASERHRLEMAQKIAEEQARSARRARIFNLVSGVLIVFALIATFFGFVQAGRATKNANEAQTASTLAVSNEQKAIANEQEANIQKAQAEAQSRRANAGQLALAAKNVRADFPQRSLLLAIEAIRISQQAREPVLPVAEEALREASLAITGIGVPDMAGATQVKFSANSHWLLEKMINENRGNLWSMEALSRNDKSHPIPMNKLLGNGQWGLYQDAEGKTSQVWWLDDLEKPGAIPLTFQGAVLDISKDGKWLITQQATDQQEISYWLSQIENRAAVGAPVELPVPPGGFPPLFSPDGTWLFSNGKLYALNGTAPREVYAYPKAAVWYFAGFSQDSSLLALVENPVYQQDGGFVGAAKIVVLRIDAGATQTIMQTDRPDLKTYFSSLKFSPDQRWLIAKEEGPQDAPLLLWDLLGDPAQPVLKIKGSGGFITNDWLFYNSYSSETNESVVEYIRLKDPDGKFAPGTPVQAPGAVIDLWNDDGSQATNDRYLVRSGDFVMGSGIGFQSQSDTGVYLGSVADPAKTLRLSGLEDGPVSFAFSPDGNWLAVGANDGESRLWNLNSLIDPGQLTFSGDNKYASMSAQGNWLAAGNSLWRIQAGRPVGMPIQLAPPEETISLAVFSRDERWLVAVQNLGDLQYPESGAATLFDLKKLEAGEPGSRIQFERNSPTNIVAFSDDSHWLVLASLRSRNSTSEAQIFDLSQSTFASPILSITVDAAWPEKPADPLDPLKEFTQIKFAQDSRYLVMQLAYPDGVLNDAVLFSEHLSIFVPEAQGWVLSESANLITGSIQAISPDLRWVVVQDDTPGIPPQAILLDLRALVLENKTIRFALGTTLDNPTFSLDGKYLAFNQQIAEIDHLALLNLQNLQENSEPPILDLQWKNYLNFPSLSSNSKWLVANMVPDETIGLMGDTQSIFQLVSTAPGQGRASPQLFGGGGGGPGSFKQDFRLGLASLQDLVSGQKVAQIELRGHETQIVAATFSSNDEFLLSLTDDQSLRLWNLEAQRRDPFNLPVILPRLQANITFFGFSPDGHFVIVLTDDNLVHLWSTQVDDMISDACDSLSRNFIINEWQRYFAEQPYRQTCPNLPEHPSARIASEPTPTLPPAPTATTSAAPGIDSVATVAVTPTLASTLPPATVQVTYTVKAGDNLYSIATLLGTDLQTLMQENNITSADLITIGQVIIHNATATPAP